MLKMRKHYLIAIAIFLITFIIGTFLDLSISKSIVHLNNGFGLTISVIGMIPGYFVFAFLGGGYIYLAVKGKNQVIFRIIMMILGIASIGIAVFYSGREFYGPNGFAGVLKTFYGYLYVLPIMLFGAYLGFIVTSKSNLDNKWLLFAIILLQLFIVLIPGTVLLKSIFHRPRFRAIAQTNFSLPFKAWYERTKNYKELMASFNLIKEEFKSFPSGHTASAMIFPACIGFLAMLNKKYEKIVVPLFYIGLVWGCLVAFSRILVGAHFLSDVSMGALLTLVFVCLGNELVIKIKNKKFNN